LNEISLSKNRLTQKSILPLISSIDNNNKILTNLNILNLSFNKLGSTSIQTIASYFENPESEISDLNLEGNLIGDSFITKLINSILKLNSHKINIINFAQNLIGEIGATACANLVEKFSNMQVMILYWNEIKNIGAYLLITALRKNPSIRVFDISWNNIGSDLVQIKEDVEKYFQSKNGLPTINHNVELVDIKGSKEINLKKKLNPIKKLITNFAKELGDYFGDETNELVHLDISHNNINEIDSKHIGNYTILLEICQKKSYNIRNTL